MTRWKRVTALAAVTLLAAAGAFAQTSGRIEGTVKDANGAALPGVTLTATAATLPGTVTAVTGDDGSFRLLSLPPGVYAVTATLDGFNTVEQRDVKVGIDRTVTLELTLTAAFTGEVTVVGEAPVVDTTQATSGVSVSSETFDQLPLARDFYAVAQIAAGASTDALGNAFYGSTSAENQYVIEGLNTTGAQFGMEGKTLNFDFIQEVEVKTGGLPAEYGRLTGGLINAITKSGGNELKGDVFGFYEGGSLQSDDSTLPDRSQTTTSLTNVDSRYEYGLDLGGYVVKDKLWFFGAYNRVQLKEKTEVIRDLGVGAPPPGAEIPRDTTSDLYAGKLTWRVDSNNNLSLSIFGDPATRDGDVFTVSGEPSTWKGTEDTGSDDYVLRYDGVFGGSWVVEGLAGLHQEQDKFSGPGKSEAQYIDTRPSGPDILSGGFGSHSDEDFERQVYKADVSKYLGDLELKFGADQEHVRATISRFNGGAGQRIYIFNNRAVPGGPVVYRHRYFVDDRAPGYRRDDPTTWRLAAPLVSEPDSQNRSAYAQGSWKVVPNLTLNVGVRWEEQDVRDRDGATALKIDDNWAPRVAFVWDPRSNGRTKLFGSFGRYYESIPMDINIRAFGGEAQCFCYNFSPDPNDTHLEPQELTGFRNSLLGGPTPVDPNLEGQYIDEVQLGYEYEVVPNFALGIQATWRDLGRVIEDFLVDPAEGTYAISNPGEGLGRTMYFYDFSPVAGEKAKRTYKSVQLDARKRYSNGWQLYASYLWSKLEGNYDGVFQASTGQIDPNVNSAFDYMDFLINADGKLSNDRTHTVKVNGSYTVQKGLFEGFTVGASAHWASGTPLTAYGYSAGYQNWEYYLTPRGSLGRNPDDYEADLHLSYPVHVGAFELQLLADVFNLLDRQAVRNYDQRYNLNGEPCGGVPEGLCNGDGGLLHDGSSLQPVGQLPGLTPSNPDFLKKARNNRDFTGQRNIRLGLRLRF